MSKRLRHDLTYDAPMADVAAMLADPAFREEVCEEQGVLRAMVTVDPDGEGMQVTIDQVQAATGIPSFAKKFVGDEINIVQQESWTSATDARHHGHHPRQARGDDRHGPAGGVRRRDDGDRRPRRSRSASRWSAARSRA